MKITKSKSKNILNLLLIKDDQTSQYVWIKDFNTFMFCQTKHHGKKYFCNRCLKHFNKPEALETHQEDCQGTDVFTQTIKMPKDKILKFNNYI